MATSPQSSDGFPRDVVLRHEPPPPRASLVYMEPLQAYGAPAEETGGGAPVVWQILAEHKLAIVLLAGLIVLYVAYPHRGEEVPHTPWVGEAMRKGVNRLPTLHNQSDEQKYASRERVAQHQ